MPGHPHGGLVGARPKPDGEIHMGSLLYFQKDKLIFKQTYRQRGEFHCLFENQVFFEMIAGGNMVKSPCKRCQPS